MQYNIFKVERIDDLKNNMNIKGYEKIENEIVSDKYILHLYCKYDDNLKLSWKNILIEFGELKALTRTGISAIILCESNYNNYALTYGASSYIVQKYSDREFGFNFAKRIDLKEMKRKSSITPHSIKNSSITSFKNTKTIVFDSGENITSLSFTPLDDFYGKRIDIGKSIKLKSNLSLKDIFKIFDKIEIDSKNAVKNNIPFLTRITDKDEIEKYNKAMYDYLRKELKTQPSSTQIFTNEFFIIGSSIYFEEEHTQIVKIGNNECEIELHDIQSLQELAKKMNVDIITAIEKGKIIYKNSFGEKIYTEPISKLINFELDEEKVSLYNGDWYYYNNDYYDLVINEIKSIKVIYNPRDDISKSEIAMFENNSNKYREEILNNILKQRYNGRLLDRDLFISKYENEFFNSKYKIEIADLLIKNEYISVKIGSSQSLAYCVDQSQLSAKLICNGKINLKDKELPIPDTYSLWLFFESYSIFDNKNVNLEKMNSIMLLSKLSEWSKYIKSLGKTPVIRINKYIKN